LYEPSVDDIRHMEEMENERKAREAEEAERQERMKKIKDQFADPNGQWEKDKTDIQNEAMREKKAQDQKEKQVQADTKPAGAAPNPGTQAKPAEVKAAEAKPAEAKPAEAKAPEAKAAPGQVPKANEVQD